MLRLYRHIEELNKCLLYKFSFFARFAEKHSDFSVQLRV